MPRLLSLYLNPTRDLSLSLDRLLPGRVLRASSWTLETAGKPVNAARACRVLGGRAEVLGFCGQSEEAVFKKELGQAGLRSRLLPLPGLSRICAVLSEDQGRETVVNSEAGLRLRAVELKRLSKRTLSLAKAGDWVLISGSLPPTLKPASVAALLSRLRAKGAAVAVDQRGLGLKALLKAKPSYVQANRLEFQQTFGINAKREAGIWKLLERLRGLGASAATFMDGARGAWLLTGEGGWRLSPPRVHGFISPIGAGDAFMGGMIYGRLQRETWPEALRWAGAAAAANVASPGACRFSRAQAVRYFSRCRIQKVP